MISGFLLRKKPPCTELNRPHELENCSKHWSAPAGKLPGRGCHLSLMMFCTRVNRDSAKGPVSRILSCAVIPLGAALPRTLISDLPGGFAIAWSSPQKALCRAKSRLNASGRCAAPLGSEQSASLPIWSCSVWGLPCPRRYRRSGALLPHHFTLTPALEFTQRRAYPPWRANSGLAFPGRPSNRVRRSREG